MNDFLHFPGLKANVSEADHPLLCEGTRRQRGDLAIAMLVHYKDDQVKLSKVRPFANGFCCDVINREVKYRKIPVWNPDKSIKIV